MTQFHTDDYIDFLSRVTPENMESFQKEQAKCMSDMLKDKDRSIYSQIVSIS